MAPAMRSYMPSLLEVTTMTATKRAGRPPIVELTTSQMCALEGVKRLLLRNGYAPTIRELGEFLGCNTASAGEQVATLVRKGYLKSEPRKARSITVIER